MKSIPFLPKNVPGVGCVMHAGVGVLAPGARDRMFFYALLL